MYCSSYFSPSVPVHPVLQVSSNTPRLLLVPNPSSPSTLATHHTTATSSENHLPKIQLSSSLAFWKTLISSQLTLCTLHFIPLPTPTILLCVCVFFLDFLFVSDFFSCGRIFFLHQPNSSSSKKISSTPPSEEKENLPFLGSHIQTGTHVHYVSSISSKAKKG